VLTRNMEGWIGRRTRDSYIPTKIFVCGGYKYSKTIPNTISELFNISDSVLARMISAKPFTILLCHSITLPYL